MPVVCIDTATWQKIDKLQKMLEIKSGVSIPKAKIVKISVDLSKLDDMFDTVDLMSINKQLRKR
jgi:hypothetical protein